MSTAFDTLKFSRNLTDAGLPEKQAVAISESLVTVMDEMRRELVTKDYLDARLEALESRMDGKFRIQFWMMGVGFSVLVLPQLRALLGG